MLIRIRIRPSGGPGGVVMGMQGKGWGRGGEGFRSGSLVLSWVTDWVR